MLSFSQLIEFRKYQLPLRSPRSGRAKYVQKKNCIGFRGVDLVSKIDPIFRLEVPGGVRGDVQGTIQMENQQRGMK